MSFRETSAWITLVSVVICFGVYFGAVFTRIALPGVGRFHLLIGCVAALVALQLGLRFFAASLAPEDARSPKDEREQLIELRAMRIGFYAMALGALACGLSLHVGRPSAFDLMNLVLLDIVAASLIVSLAQIIQFRRGSVHAPS